MTYIEEIKQLHLGWLDNPNTSQWQLEDSKTILNLLAEVERLREALKEIHEFWKNIETPKPYFIGDKCEEALAQGRG